MVTLISGTVDYKKINITRDKKEHFIMIKHFIIMKTSQSIRKT